MTEFLRSTPAQAVIWVTVLVIIVTVGVYIATRFRDRGDDGFGSASNLLTDFRDLHDQGSLSQTEFRKIKSVLGEKLQDEIDSNHAGDSG